MLLSVDASATRQLQSRLGRGCVWRGHAYPCADEVITPEGKLDIPKIRPLAQLGYYDYTSVTEVFEMRVLGAHGLLNVRLEGKSS